MKILIKKNTVNSRKSSIIKAKKFKNKVLRKAKCIKCSATGAVILEFHHKDRFKKSKSVSDLVHKGSTLKSIKEEIRKCDIMCRNCHSITTANQRQYHKYLESI